MSRKTNAWLDKNVVHVSEPVSGDSTGTDTRHPLWEVVKSMLVVLGISGGFFYFILLQIGLSV